ncbi:hypothetical protein F4775DRAFT_601971 [Biscogniauxia sp. FL1348]|nr:hypothetical protein F4775DRAFT_601971 [Biscogniauxia sp. FL1348]
MSTLGDSLGALAITNPDPVDQGDNNVVMNTSAEGIAEASEANASPVDATVSGAVDHSDMETEVAIVDSNSTETESAIDMATPSIEDAEPASTDIVVSADANKDATTDIVTETQVVCDADAKSTTDTVTENDVVGNNESSVPEAEEAKEIEQTQNPIIVSAAQENSNEEDEAIASDNSETVNRITALPASVEDENEDSSSDVTIMATSEPAIHGAPVVATCTMSGHNATVQDAGLLHVENEIDASRAIVEGGEEVHIEVTNIGEDYNHNQFAPVTILGHGSQDGYDGGSEFSGQTSISSDSWATTAGGFHPAAGAAIHNDPEIFAIDPSNAAGGPYFPPSTYNDDASSTVSNSTLVASIDGPHEPEDSNLDDDDVSGDDYIAINPTLYPGQDFHVGPNAHGPVVSFIVRTTEIFVHYDVLGYSQLLQSYFHDGTTFRARVRVTGDGPAAWRLLTMALYTEQWHPTRSDFAAPDFVEALLIARRWGFAELIQRRLKDLTARYFAHLSHWKGVVLNGLTADFHRKLLREINDAYVLCKGMPEPRPFPLTAFGLVVLRSCPAAVWAAYSQTVDETLFRQIADVAIREMNVSPFMHVENSLISSL